MAKVYPILAAMPRYAAFLRAINVGGHVVTMERLRGVFEAGGFTGVRTILASGNVVFEAGARAGVTGLEAKIAAALEAALGYEVATFIRTPAELAAIAAARPFPARSVAAPGARLFVGFLPNPFAAVAKKTVLAMGSDADDLVVSGREIYWLCRVPMVDAEFSPAKLEKELRIPATFRNVNTVRKVAAAVAR
jgi:uncharacterized protein (DUF1697 family)